MQIFQKIKVTVGTGKCGFEIAQNGADLDELGQLPRIAANSDIHPSWAPRIDYAVEARKAIGEDPTFGFQSRSLLVFLRPYESTN